MSLTEKSRLPDVVNKYEQDILQDWMKQQLSVDTLRADLIKEAELREQSAKFLALFRRAPQNGSLADMTTSHWDEVRELLADVSASRARQGFTPSETATFVFSLKQPLFTRLQKELGKDGDAFMAEVWAATVLLDKLGLHTMEMFQKSQEEVIGRQQQGLLELSTPVVRLWEGVLALPLIGTLDSERTQIVMQNLLQRIVETGSVIAIIDITGVPVVDTLVAQHLLKTVSAARLMGADCIISGIRPQIAQTIVHLGIELTDITTKATLADALAVALQRSGFTVNRVQPLKA